MKKLTLRVKGTIRSKNRFYLLFALLPLLIQSCETSELVASADANKQKFTGPSYPIGSTNKYSPSENIGVLIVLGTWHGVINGGGGGAFNNTNSSGSGNLYASTDKGPAAFFNPNESTVNKQSYNFTDNLLFKGGLEFISKRSSDGGGSTTSLSYLQVPLYVLYQYQLQGAGNIFGGLGPYLAYGIGGSVSDGKNSTSAFGDGGFNRFDAGLSITAGYKIPQSFSFSLAYDMGLANIQPDGMGDKARNTGFSLNVGYPLNKLIDKIKGK